MEDVIEFVKAPADDHSRNQLTSVSQLQLPKDYILHVPNFAISIGGLVVKLAVAIQDLQI
jgi:hypothetical protein